MPSSLLQARKIKHVLLHYTYELSRSLIKIYHSAVDQVFRHTRIALEPRNIWVPMAFQDPVLMQATILVGAMSQAVIRGYSIAKCQVAYFYKTQTIALLNERLKVSSNEPASDATILAVCVLISLEVCSQDSRLVNP
jgi:hypothetical protein